MKHIRKFESLIEHTQQARTESMKNDIMDMSLEIQDDGFRVEVSDDPDTYYKGFGYSPDFIISISKHNEQFYIDEIKDFLLRVNRYCETLQPGKSNLLLNISKYSPLSATFASNRDTYSKFWRPFEIDHLSSNKVSRLSIKVRAFR